MWTITVLVNDVDVIFISLADENRNDHNAIKRAIELKIGKVSHLKLVDTETAHVRT